MQLTELHLSKNINLFSPGLLFKLHAANRKIHQVNDLYLNEQQQQFYQKVS
jgi:hypothetical protein